ncbi:hypothetical protein CIT292_10563 [Citrobacter youngae ATCC 29220]|uniref:Uncharacterized protein n=1 Tax=Citrobacter youngae ATCC 29220 TaxID=500640 RepID=D4BJ46_9ENTR|nr:hypothetical protein CIT292_10563 [Citrobacter youngae ATCC 29220]
MLTGPTGPVGRIRPLRRHPATVISHVEITVVQMATRAAGSLPVFLAPHSSRGRYDTLSNLQFCPGSTLSRRY